MSKYSNNICIEVKAENALDGFSDRCSNISSHSEFESPIKLMKLPADFEAKSQHITDNKMKSIKPVNENSLIFKQYTKAFAGNIFKINGNPINEENRTVIDIKNIENKIPSHEGILVPEKLNTEHYRFNFNKFLVIIAECRSMSFPNKLKTHSEDTVFEMSPKDRYGASVSDQSAYFTVKYGKEGKLNNISISHKPYVCKNSEAPVVIIVNNGLCTLPVNNGHFKHLCSLIEKNGGSVDYLNDALVPENIVELAGESNSDSCCIIS